MDFVSACNDIAICATFYHKVLPYFEILLQVLGAIAVVATALVRLPYFAKYQGPVDTLHGKFLQFTRWLPTIGINPQTKKLEEAAENSAKIP